MGCGSSKPPLISENEGDGKQFLERFEVDKVLGEGEFGVVKLIHAKNAGPNGIESSAVEYPMYACKMLRKGMQFKDNTLYSPIKPLTLRTECEILRTLNGKHYNVKLIGIYESPSTIYIVTDFCAGGEMMEYISACYSGEEEGLTTDDVSRMSFQLLDAISYCAKFGIMHRDIKPENIMFKSKTRGAALQLIDFGSGSIESLHQAEKKDENGQTTMLKQSDGSSLIKHSTYAGTAFYISPEIFRESYTYKTDVWSVGVTLYVLVSGYPADDLQAAFNILQDSGAPDDRKNTLRKLPNIPLDMPESYYDMLEMCLTYRHRNRMSAEKILEQDFPQFHKHIDKVESTEGSRLSTPTSASGILSNVASMFKKTGSFIIKGLSNRHATMLDYARYERSISTLLATMLTTKQLSRLLREIDSHIEESSLDDKTHEQNKLLANKKLLQIITMETLCSILARLQFNEVGKIIDEMPASGQYQNFAYHIALLRQFLRVEDIELENEVVDTGDDSSVSKKLNSAMKQASQKFPTPVDKSDDKTAMNLQASVHNPNNVWKSFVKTNESKRNANALATSTHSAFL